MTQTLLSPLVTPEELDNLPDAVNYELLHGNLLERNMAAESSQFAV